MPKVARTYIAEHNRDRPKASPFWSILGVPQLSPAPLFPYLLTLRSEVAGNAVTNDSSIVGIKITFSTHNWKGTDCWAFKYASVVNSFSSIRPKMHVIPKLISVPLNVHTLTVLIYTRKWYPLKHVKLLDSGNSLSVWWVEELRRGLM